MKRFLIGIIFILAPLARAQFTLVSGTVKDNIGLPYAGGTIAAVLNISGSPVITATNQPYTPPTGLVNLDINGNFSMQLATNSALSPGGSTWTFIVCSTSGTVLGAWGTNSACFKVPNLTISGSSQNISRQIQNLAQPLTYSASLIAYDSPTCAKLAGPVQIDTSNLDSTGLVTIKASSLSSTSVIGVAVAIPGSGCLGPVQVATSLLVPCVTDNSSTVGDVVTASSSVTGECTDAGAGPVSSSIGIVMRANTGVGTVSMVLLQLNSGGGISGGGISGGIVPRIPYWTSPTSIGNTLCSWDTINLLQGCPAYDVTGTGPWTINTTYGITPSLSSAGNTSISVDPVSGCVEQSVNGGAYACLATATQAAPGCSPNAVQVNVGGGFGCASETDDNVTPVRGPNGYDVRTQGAYSMEILNNTVTGTQQSKMGCDDGAGKVLICPHTTSTTNIGFDVLAGAGNSGNAVVSIYGFLPVFFDNGATALHYAIGSPTVDGDLHDTGSTSPPTSGQPYYLIWTANTGAGTIGYIRVLTPEELNAAGTGGGGDQIQVNSVASRREANFNNSSPSAPANAVNVLWQLSSAGNLSSISAYLQGDGNATHCLLGTGVFGACPGAAGSGANKVSFDQCSPAETTNPGNVAWTTTNFGGSVWDAGHWEFVGNSNADLYCSVRVPSNLVGTPSIILDFFSADSTAGHTITLNTCDATTASHNLNVGSLTCAATQVYTSTATAYSVTELTFAVQSTAVVDQYLVVQIHQASGGDGVQLLMEPPKLRVF
jgi:hypothetical protein